jgi:hypothetical protein
VWPWGRVGASPTATRGLTVARVTTRNPPLRALSRTSSGVAQNLMNGTLPVSAAPICNALRTSGKIPT